MTTIEFEAAEVQPKELVTVNENLPGGMADTVALVPVPEIEDAPGIRVTDHDPSAGRPSSMAVPVLLVQVGWVCVLATGAAGIGGRALITIPEEAGEVHPASFVTVNVWVPGRSPGIVALLPVPPAVIPAGSLVSVQVPVEGNPDRLTVPVSRVQVG